MSGIGWVVLLIFVFVGGASFFSTNTIALRLFSRPKLQEEFKSLGKKDFSEQIAQKTRKLILTCSFFRLICNMAVLLLLFIAFMDSALSATGLANFLIILVITTSIFTISNLAIPHAWARYSSEKILARTYSSLMLLTAVSAPLLYIFSLHDKVVRRLAGVVETTPEELQEEKQEEFLTDLEQQRIEGVVDEEEQEMIENVLELSDTDADEIMTPRTDVVAIEVNSGLEDILKIVNSAGHSRVPVYEENIDNIIGFVYAKDLLSEVGKTAEDFRLRDKLRKAYFVPETKSLRALLHEFQNRKLHIAVVLDEYGGTAGIVTIEDILEELVGEITDEYEQTPPEHIIKIDENTFDVDARTYIDDLNDDFEMNLPEEEDYDTIGGFVFSHLGYIPKTGEQFDYENLKFTIRSAEARKIKRIRIQKVGEQ